MNNYILDANGEPVACSVEECLDWITVPANFNGPRIVKQEKLPDNSLVSTVFLGINHAFSGGEPILWETMVFGGPCDEVQERCGGKRADALAMHEETKKRALAFIGGSPEVVLHVGPGHGRRTLKPVGMFTPRRILP